MQELLGSFAEWTKGITLIPGSGGQFEVVVNGDLVFSKKKEGRFPELGELMKAVQAKLD